MFALSSLQLICPPAALHLIWSGVDAPGCGELEIVMPTDLGIEDRDPLERLLRQSAEHETRGDLVLRNQTDLGRTLALAGRSSVASRGRFLLLAGRDASVSQGRWSAVPFSADAGHEGMSSLIHGESRPAVGA